MNKKTVLIIIISLILVLAAAAVFFFVSQNKSTKPVATTEYSPGEAFVTNIYGTESLIKLNVMLQIRQADQERVVASNNMIRDTILKIMRSQEIEIYEQADTLDRMAEIIQTELNRALDAQLSEPRPEYELSDKGVDISGQGTVLRVYFVEFVMQ